MNLTGLLQNLLDSLIVPTIKRLLHGTNLEDGTVRPA